MSFTSSLTKKENSINSVHILISMLQSLIGIHVFNSSFFMSNESKYISAASFCKWHHYLMNFSKKVITFFIKDFDIMIYLYIFFLQMIDCHLFHFESITCINEVVRTCIQFFCMHYITIIFQIVIFTRLRRDS